jgi:Cytochrome c oxidase biogenesis protein Cmc1 like
MLSRVTRLSSRSTTSFYATVCGKIADIITKMDQSGEQYRELSAEEVARLKSAGRESRLSFRNIAEAQLRRELKEVAIELCDPAIKEFAQCSQEKGLMVVISCRHLFKNVNECMAINNGEEAWQKYKNRHADEIERRANMGLDK